MRIQQLTLLVTFSLASSTSVHSFETGRQQFAYVATTGTSTGTTSKLSLQALKVRGGALSKKAGNKKKKLPTPVLNKEGATIPQEVFNLVKGIVGVGVLSLPSGIAAFGNSPAALVPAIALITVIGILSGYGFALIGKVCAYTGTKSFRDAWSASVSEKTSWIPAWSATLKTFAACLAFSMVLADTFSGLLNTDARTKVLLSVTSLILLPLCWMKNLASLAPFSLLGVIGMAYTALAMALRYFDGSYKMPDGGLLSGVSESLLPSFGSKGLSAVFSPNSLILVCMLSTAYMAHFNAPKFYLELKNNTIGRYHQVVAWSFGLSIAIMGMITGVGFLTFGENCSGLVLNNYSGKDKWIFASRVAVAISLVFSYPLAFQGCRDGVLDLLRKEKSNKVLNITTILLLSSLTFLAATLTDVSFVLAFGGATLGNALTYVYPAIMYSQIVKKQGRDEKVGVTIANISAVLGIVMGAIGAKQAIASL